MIRGSWCSKSSLAKAAGAEVAVQQTGEKWHAAVARSTFVSQNAQNTPVSEPFLNLRSGKMARRCGAKHTCKSKCLKHHNRWTNFGRSDVQKSHAAVARSNICKSKCAKHHTLGPLFEVKMFKNGTRLWRQAHLQVKMWKKLTGTDYFLHSRCWKNHTAAVARSTFASQNVQNTCVLQHFERFLPD